MAKARLLEFQCYEVKETARRKACDTDDLAENEIGSVSRERGRNDSVSNPCSQGQVIPTVNGDNGINGTPKTTYYVNTAGTARWSKGREPYDYGGSVVVRAGESPAHGEGTQGRSSIGNEDKARCLQVNNT
jgi:hypothetical protein